MKMVLRSNIYAKYSEKKVWANSVDLDQTAPIGSGATLFAILTVLLDTSKDNQTDLVKIYVPAKYIW